MILIYFYNNQTFLFLLVLLLYFCLLLLTKYRKRRYLKPEYSDTLTFKKNLLQYLDRYYMTNKVYTFFAVGCYIFFHSAWILIYRLFYFENKTLSNTNISHIDYTEIIITFYTICHMVSFLVLLIVTFVIFKVMLDQLFFLETLKLHFYLLNYEHYYRIIHYTNKYYLINLWGKLYLFFYNISLLRETHLDILEEYYDFYEYRTIYENHFIFNLGKTLAILAKKYTIIHFTSKVITSLFRWLYRNMRLEGFFNYVIYILLSVILLCNILGKYLDYTNYLFIFFYTILQIINYIKFYKKRDPMFDGVIQRYFNDTLMDYKTKRSLLQKDVHHYYNNMNENTSSDILLHYLRDNSKNGMMNYILHDCISYDARNPEIKKLMKKYHATHRRYCLLTLLSLILVYIHSIKDRYSITLIDKFELPIDWLIVTFLMILIYLAINIYKLDNKDLNDTFFDYIYKPKYNLLFWILFLVIVSFCGILIIKGNLFLISDGILFNFGGIKIIRNYTIEEKIAHFYNHFYNILYILQNSQYGANIISDLLYLEDALSWKNFITTYTTMEESKTYAEILIQCYLEQLNSHVNKVYQEHMENKVFFNVVATAITSWSSLSALEIFLKALPIVKNTHSVETFKLIKWILTTVITILKK